MKMNKSLCLTAILAFMLPAYAGLYQPADVNVDLTNKTAGGDMLSARFDTASNVFIGCGVRVFSIESSDFQTTFGFCQAEDATGVRGFCNTDDAYLLDVIKATTDFSYVTFSWNDDGRCERIGFSAQSFYLPKSIKP